MPRGTHNGRDIACPFWKREDETSITCEGLGPKMKTVVCFATKERKANYSMRRCRAMQGYKCCLMAKALMEKYENGGK